MDEQEMRFIEDEERMKKEEERVREEEILLYMNEKDNLETTYFKRNLSSLLNRLCDTSQFPLIITGVDKSNITICDYHLKNVTFITCNFIDVSFLNMYFTNVFFKDCRLNRVNFNYSQGITHLQFANCELQDLIFPFCAPWDSGDYILYWLKNQKEGEELVNECQILKGRNGEDSIITGICQMKSKYRDKLINLVRDSHGESLPFWVE